MNTTKKLIIGTAALAAVVTGMQGQEENAFIGDREVLDYRNSGLKEFKRAHRLYMATRLDLRNNDLGELVLPAGMVYLKTINLTGNSNFTNLFLQQDTAIEDPFILDVYLESIDNVKISVPSWHTGLRVWAYIDPINNKEHLDKYKDLIRRYGWQNGSPTRFPFEYIPNLEVRPNGVELLKESDSLPFYKNSWILCWGAGYLEVNYRNLLANGEWRKLWPNRGGSSSSAKVRNSRRAKRIESWFPTLRTEFQPSYGHERFGFYRLDSWDVGDIRKLKEPTPIPIPVKEIE